MFGKGKETINGKDWNWDTFTTTEGFPISDNLIDWVVGQDKAMEECKLCIDEWMNKLSWLIEKKWWKSFEDPMGDKPQPKEMLPSGPFLFMAGDAGTGKSLIGRALANHMTELYLKHRISLHDVLAWRNPIVPSEPKISIHEAGKGREIIASMFKKKRPSWLRRNALKLLLGGLIGTGIFLTGLTVFDIWKWVNAEYDVSSTILAHAQLLLGGIGLIGIGAMIYIFSHIIGGVTNQGGYSIGGAESKATPKLLVNNASLKAPFIDATGHTSAQLFGDITWDPLQSGGLGTPEHQRVNAGDVHRAHLGILFIDEIKNLIGPEAVTLLTVLEDGQMSITHRGHHGETGAMMVATEPIPAMCFLVAAGNFDSLDQIHPALMDRITGYGKVVRMNNEMNNTVENRRKYVQFISQEIKRFHLLPFSKEACERIIDEGRRKSGYNDKLTTKFRPMISVIKTASVLAMNKNRTSNSKEIEVMKQDENSGMWTKTKINVVEDKDGLHENKKIVEARHVIEAIEDHCKTIHKQLLEYMVDRSKPFMYVNPDEEPRIGQISGLSVMSFADDMVGQVTLVKASMVKNLRKDPQKSYFTVTGIAKPTESEWIQDSVWKVRHVITGKFEIDPAIDYKTMIDFQQENNVDGPSAGITMTLALASIILKKKIRQDVAVTGEITIDSEGKTVITPIGGVDAKIRAAQYWGYKKVVIPIRNYKHSIIPSDYNIEIVGAETLEDYMKEVFV